MADVLVTIARFASSHEAHLARGMLETHGIFVALLDENVTRALGAAGRYVGGIRLQVRERDAASAVELLELSGTRAEIERPPRNEPSENTVTRTAAAGDDRCPLCGAPPRGLFARLAERLGFLSEGSFRSRDLACSLCGRPRAG